MKQLRILVVDDDALIAEMLAETLVGMGYDVRAIEGTERDTVASALRCKPDLMIVDMCLGDGSGVAAVEQIHRNGPIPHIFVSADTKSLRALNSAAVVLQKPYREADLARAIQRTLGPPAVA
jgi:CheY-like chemotaxis protein